MSAQNIKNFKDEMIELVRVLTSESILTFYLQDRTLTSLDEKSALKLYSQNLNTIWHKYHSGKAVASGVSNVGTSASMNKILEYKVIQHVRCLIEWLYVYGNVIFSNIGVNEFKDRITGVNETQFQIILSYNITQVAKDISNKFSERMKCESHCKHATHIYNGKDIPFMPLYS